MKKYSKPEMSVENLVLDKDIADLELKSVADLNTGASDKDTFENLFGQLN